MNKTIIFSTITGTVVYFLLEWLFYGVLFTSLHPKPNSILFILLGSLFYVLMFSVIFSTWTTIRTFKAGFSAGLILGLLYSLSISFYITSSNALNVKILLTEVFIITFSTAIMCGVVAFTIGKTKL